MFRNMYLHMCVNIINSITCKTKLKYIETEKSVMKYAMYKCIGRNIVFILF